MCHPPGFMIVLVCSALCGVAEGQSVETRPVARLISSTPAVTRPRRVASATTEASIASPGKSPNIEDANPIEKKAFEQTNAERAKSGFPPLIWDPDLCRMARTNSENMARLGYFSHETPQGEKLRDRARAVGITRYTVIGENIAYNFGYEDPGAFAVERWMLSPGHRANILYAGFKAMAVGSFIAADGSVFITQTFITR